MNQNASVRLAQFPIQLLTDMPRLFVSHVETFLNYADRFYHRQFLTREKAAHIVLERLESVLTVYFNSQDLLAKGLPTVSYIAHF
ncbi:hypothetical protein GCM10028810_18540 [Spirosoma litoris]